MIARVSASEHALVSIARAILGELSPDAVAPVLRRTHAIEGLRPTSMRLLKETLALGVVRELARRGGWCQTRHLKAGTPVTGRLWERHAPLTLRFTEASFELCRWLAAVPLGNLKISLLGAREPLSLADELLLYLAADLLVRTELAPLVSRTPRFRQSRFVWLGFLPELADDSTPSALSFQSLVSGEGAVALEALQWDLGRRWVQSHRSLRELTKCPAVQRRGLFNDAVLSRFLADCDGAGRRDLAGFLIEASGMLLDRHRTAVTWVGTLDETASLNQRAAARKATGALLRHLRTLHKWAQEAQQTAFFDDNYQAAQSYAARWELIGDEGSATAEMILRDLEAMDFGTAPAAAVKDS